MFERFTEEAREVVRHAQVESRGAGAGHVGTEHLLLGLLAPAAGVTREVLLEAGVDVEGVRRAVAAAASAPPEAVLGPEDAAALRQVGIDLDAVLRRIEESFGAEALPTAPPPRRRRLLHRVTGGHTRFTPRAKKVLELSLREAIRLEHREIGSPHVLLGLLRDGGGLGARVLAECGVDLRALRAAVLSRLPQPV